MSAFLPLAPPCPTPAGCLYPRHVSSRAPPARSRRRRSPPLASARPVARAAPPALAPVVSFDVPGFPNWRYAGPEIDVDAPRALPAVVYFALTAEQSLELAPFNQFARFVLRSGDYDAAAAGASPPSGGSETNPDGGAALRVFSVTLPFHGDMQENESALTAWADRYSEGADVVSFFTRRVSASLDKLIAAGHVDAGRVYSAGLSRGGLLAAHLALANPVVDAVLGFSPVTSLAGLAEFRELAGVVEEEPTSAVTRKLNAASLLSEAAVEGLSRKAVRCYSGNSDTRVGTRSCFDFMEALAARAASRKERSSPHEYIMFCSMGREGHGTSSDVFCVGARWLLRRAGLRK